MEQFVAGVACGIGSICLSRVDDAMLAGLVYGELLKSGKVESAHVADVFSVVRCRYVEFLVNLLRDNGGATVFELVSKKCLEVIKLCSPLLVEENFVLGLFAK